jgi:adenylosuccinate synthase
MTKGSAIVVLGAQWGDEGKGKVIDKLAENADAVVRFNGGANAGHTLVVGKNTYHTHLLPSGIIRAGTINITGPGVAHDLDVLSDELNLANTFGSEVFLDRSAPLVLPIHKEIDYIRERIAGKSALGTTARGIGPAYEDFWGRRGLKLGDLVSENRIALRLAERGYYAEKCALLKYLGIDAMSFDEVVSWCLSFSEIVRPRLEDTRAMVKMRHDSGKQILFEGAQGILLDTLHGSQPYTTSSTCTLAGVSATFGVYDFDRVIGVTKAYATRVGAGPFPTGQNNADGDKLRKIGQEVGTTTGRDRRCGWLDLVALRYACRVGGITELVVTKLDILSNFEMVQAGVKYTFEGMPIDENITLTSRIMRDAVVGYCLFPGWKVDISYSVKLSDLPDNARRFLEKVRDFTKIPISGVGIGPQREQLIHN